MEELSAELLATESADAVRLKLEDESRGKLSDSGQGGDAGVGDDAVSFMATLVGCWVLWHIPCVADRAVPRWQQQQHSCDRGGCQFKSSKARQKIWRFWRQEI